MEFTPIRANVVERPLLSATKLLCSHAQRSPLLVPSFFTHLAGDASGKAQFDPGQIGGCTFQVMSAEQIQDMSVLQIRSTEDLNSPLLGATPKQKCGTCGMNNQGCPGHFGFFRLPVPVFHPFYIALLTRVLNCICIFCHQLKISGVMLLMNFPRPLCNTTTPLVHRLKQIAQLCQRQPVCFFCGKKPVHFRAQASRLAIEIQTDDGWCSYPAGFAFTALKHVSTFELFVLGFEESISHPADCVLRVLPILPPVGRPSTKTSRFAGSGTDVIECEDDLTTEYQHIINACKNRVDTNELSAFIERLFIDSGKAQLVLNRKHSAPVISFRRRWVGKGGRMRREIMGKRTNHCARSVVTCDCDLEADEVGVPVTVLSKITQPVVVCEWNIKLLSLRMRQGSILFVRGGDGITRGIGHLAVFSIVFESGDCIIRKGNKYRVGHCYAPLHADSVPLPVQIDGATFQLCIGDILLRNGVFSNPLSFVTWPALKFGDILLMCPQLGDPILFNRQPTLVEESMVGMRIRPLPIRSFACTCAPLEAMRGDYDGDEVNIHFPQSEIVTSELKHLLMLEQQIVTGQSSRPVVRVIQDAIVGFFWLLTKQFEPGEFMHLACMIEYEFGVLLMRLKQNKDQYYKYVVQHNSDSRVSMFGLSGVPWEYSGLALLSLLVPSSFSFVGSATPDVLRTYVCRRARILPLPLKCDGGVWIGGVGDAATLNGKSGIIHELMLYHGNKASLFFITGVQRLTGNLSRVGYSSSIGITDCTINESIFSSSKSKLLNLCHSIETEDVNMVVQLRHVAETDILHSMSVQHAHINAFVLLTALGSKGNLSNIFQSCFALGQQVIEGSLVDLNWTGKAMAYVPLKSARNAQHRGFVLSSFREGLSPLEFFFHAMAGREALVEAATSTANSGYKMRLSVKKMEHSTLQYDMTVRDRDGSLIQFLYGDNGLNQKYVWPNGLPWNLKKLLKLVINQRRMNETTTRSYWQEE